MRKTWVFGGALTTDPRQPRVAGTAPQRRVAIRVFRTSDTFSPTFAHPNYFVVTDGEGELFSGPSRCLFGEVRTGPKVGSSQSPIGRSPMFCIVVPCGEPEQKRPPPTVKAAFGGSGQPDLNRRPRRPERRALPGCAMPRLNCRHVYRADSGSRSGPTPSRILSTCP